MDNYIQFQKKHPKMRIDDALDSLQKEKTFFNRFLYNRSKMINSFADEEESKEQFANKVLSYGSVALFILLPLFTLSLKLFYIRRKYNYIDHLIFVFHTQTVFFILLTIYFLLRLFDLKSNIFIFLLLFLIYLFIAMKKFYQQGYFKTFFKFILINISYIIVSSIGITAVFFISLALY